MNRSQQTRIHRKAAFLMLALSAVCIAVLALMLPFVFPAVVLPFACAYLCMSAFVWFVSPYWGSACTERVFVAGLFGVAVYLLGAFIGSLVSYFVIHTSTPLLRHVSSMFGLLSVVGVVPAFLIGLVGALVSRHLNAQNQVA